LVGSSPWITWPPAEQRALRAFFRALWLDRIESTDEDDDGCRVDDALCAIGVVETSIEWYLDTWSSSEGPTAKANMRAFLAVNRDDLVEGDLANPFWNADPPADANKAAVIRWARDQLRVLADTD
jgi:hypothetical protein